MNLNNLKKLSVLLGIAKGVVALVMIDQQSKTEYTGYNNYNNNNKPKGRKF